MSVSRLRIVIFGLSITSSWGNGHATTYRGLVRELSALGHDVLFLERNLEWYAANRDLPKLPLGQVVVYHGVHELKRRFSAAVRHADLVIIGSYVPEGIAIGEWVTRIAQGFTAFYDIDTPVTLAQLTRGHVDYLSPELIAKYHLYLSFTGGPILKRLERVYQSPMARSLYCAVDPELYYPEQVQERWDLAYMGTYSTDRQRTLARFMFEPARRWPAGRFAVVGPQYPRHICWPRNVRRIEHLAPHEHRGFYTAQRFALNLTRADMVIAGYSPSVRLFEAAACGAAIVSDWWDGLDVFFSPGKEILIAHSPDEMLCYLRDLPDEQRRAIGANARARVLAEHTSAHRARELEGYVRELATQRVAM